MPIPIGLAKLERCPPATVHCPANASVSGANSSTRLLPTVSETSSPPLGSSARPRGACQRAEPARRGADRAQEAPFRAVYLDAVVGRVGHVVVARRVARHRPRESQLPRFRAVAAPRAEEAQFGVELDDAVAEVVGDVHVARRVERDAVGEAELPRTRALRARRALVGAVRVEFLDPVVVVVGDEHLARVRRHAARVARTARAPSPSCPIPCLRRLPG